MTPQPSGGGRPGGRILALDPGEKRIGVAAADLRTRVAVPVTTIEAGDDPVEAAVRLVRDEDADAVVVGLALSLSGAAGPQAQRAQAFAAALAQRLGIPVHTWDERLTTAEARRRLPRPSGRAPGRGKRRPRRDLDAEAAAIILQAYLDSRGPSARG